MFGSGGRMNVLVSPPERCRRQRGPLELPEVDARLGDREASDQVLRERVGRHVPEGAPDLVNEGDTNRVLGDRDLDQPLPSLLARGQRLREEVLEEVDLDPPLAHLLDEAIVLELRPLDPQHVVEQQLVVVRRGQPLETEIRAMDHHLAQLAHLGVGTELCHRSSVRLSPASITTPPPGSRPIPPRSPRCPRVRRSLLACPSGPRTGSRLRPWVPWIQRRTRRPGARRP